MSRPFYYGGQAVMEGVMMRGQRQMAVAVRQPDGKIALFSEPLTSWIYRSPVRHWLFVRGVFVLWDALMLGMRALTFSANVAYIELERADQEQARAKGGAAAVAKPVEEPQPLAAPILWGMVAFSLLFGIGLFFVVPLFLIHWLDRWITSSLVSNLIEGLIRLGILIGYLALIGRVGDIKRVFGYHGAEHKTINAYEHGEPLTVEAVQRQSTLHTRCGTGFLLIVVLFSIVVFAFLGRPPLPLRILSRVVLVPAIAAVAYEFLRFSARYYSNLLVRLLVMPSLALQRLTTREPDNEMVETSIVAFKRVLVADGLLTEAELLSERIVLVDTNGQPLAVPERVPVGVAVE